MLIGIDRDNTLVNDPGYLGKDDNWKEQIKILSEIEEGLKVLRKLNCKIIIATNQAGVARGFYGVERVKEVNSEIARVLKEKGIEFDGWYFSPFVDSAYAERRELDNEWVQDNGMRKPGIGMLEIASKELDINLKDGVVFVGDRALDVLTGINAGGYGIFVPNKLTIDEEKEKVDEVKKKYGDRVYVASGFLDACRWISQLMN